MPGANSSLPTIWFEADAAHGIVDFLGLQTSLALDHGRNSCSYDPPNFGWSDPLPSNSANFFDYFNPLLIALQRHNEEIVIVGWGAGAENALIHAIEKRNTTKSLVLMDASPEGIEWFDAQRKNNWSETEMLNYRSADLSSRVCTTRTILGLGIPWYVTPCFTMTPEYAAQLLTIITLRGLMPILNPANSTGYFDQSLYPRYLGQSMKAYMWAYQYYSLVHEASSPIDTFLVNTTAPSGMGVYALMTSNSGNPPTDNDSNDFYRKTKLSMANHIAGGNLSSPVIWCEDRNCSMSFPVNNPVWTANALMSLGI